MAKVINSHIDHFSPETKTEIKTKREESRKRYRSLLSLKFIDLNLKENIGISLTINNDNTTVISGIE